MIKKVKSRPCACGFILTADNTACDEHLKMHAKYIRQLIDGKRKKVV